MKIIHFLSIILIAMLALSALANSSKMKRKPDFNCSLTFTDGTKKDVNYFKSIDLIKDDKTIRDINCIADDIDIDTLAFPALAEVNNIFISFKSIKLLDLSQLKKVNLITININNNLGFNIEFSPHSVIEEMSYTDIIFVIKGISLSGDAVGVGAKEGTILEFGLKNLTPISLKNFNQIKKLDFNKIEKLVSFKMIQPKAINEISLSSNKNLMNFSLETQSKINSFNFATNEKLTLLNFSTDTEIEFLTLKGIKQPTTLKNIKSVNQLITKNEKMKNKIFYKCINQTKDVIYDTK